MIKFRGQRVDNGEWVEGSHHYWKHFGKVVHAIYIEGYFIPFELHSSTLQVMTTDGWADIADVEVVRKNPAKSLPMSNDNVWKCEFCGKADCESDHK